ncbi:MAG: acyltransferase [Neptuniibacter sp.]
MLNIRTDSSNGNLFRADIQALRGIAVLLVIFYHADFPGLEAGYLGVDLFFVISGYLITSIIKRQIEEDRFSFKQFYFGRARRLLPAAYVVIIITVIISPVFLNHYEFNDLKYQVLGAVTFTINGILWLQSGYFDAEALTKPFLHFWSLAVEYQYYFILPFILYLMPSRLWYKANIIIGGSSFLLSLYLSSSYPDAAFYLLPTRIWEFALGSFLVLSVKKYSFPAWIGFLAVFVIVLFSFNPTGFPHPGLDSLIVCIAVLCVLSCNYKKEVLDTKAVRFLVVVGNISYSLYLVHWPVIVFVKSSYYGQPPLAALAIALLVSVMIAFIIYKFIEVPLRKELTFSNNVIIKFILVSLFIAASPKVMSSLVEEVRGGYEAVFFGHIPCGKLGDKKSLAMPACSFGNEGGNKVLLIGDSHSRQFAYGFSVSNISNKYQFYSLFSGRCLPFPDRKLIRNGIVDQKCLDVKAKMISSLDEGDYDIVVLAARWSIYDPLTVAEIKWIKDKAKKPVVLFGPIPNPKLHRPCLVQNDGCSLIKLTQNDLDTNLKLKKAALDIGIEYVDLIEVGCKNGYCPFYINRKSVYSDKNHLSMVGSEFYIDGVVGRLEKLLDKGF